MLGLKRLNGSMRMLALVAACALTASAGAETRSLDYRILATQKTSTMEKELNEAAAAGYRFSKVMGGQTANGGKEVVVAMIKDAGEVALGTRHYRLLATNRTSTMQTGSNRSSTSCDRTTYLSLQFEKLDKREFLYRHSKRRRCTRKTIATIEPIQTRHRNRTVETRRTRPKFVW